jgi:hypothetical protein
MAIFMAWLRNLGLGNYEAAFRENELDGTVLPSLTHENLKELVRQDDPPRVTLIDFKSGDPESDNHQKLTEEEMRVQVAIYGVAAKRELEYEPERGLVRYLDVTDDQTTQHWVPAYRVLEPRRSPDTIGRRGSSFARAHSHRVEG